MSSNKTFALALCFAITGCAQTPQNDADGGSWWPFGSSDKVAAKEPAAAPAPLKPAATAPVAKADSANPVAKTESANPWYWPFGSEEVLDKKPEAKPVEVAKAEAEAAIARGVQPGGSIWRAINGR